VSWVEVFAVFVVSHLVGDYLVQTDWQAQHKRGGLGGDPVRRRALFSHVISYTVAFVPAFVWIADDLGAGVAWAVAAVFLPHLAQDDGRVLTWFVYRVKGCTDETAPVVFKPVDQTFHILALFALAIAIGAAT
jgi:hypothetical protein